VSDEDGDSQAPAVTPRMLSWAKNSTLYRLSRRMMSERELADAIKRKARQKFEGISSEDLQRLATTALEFGRTLGALDDRNYAETKVRTGVRSGRSKRLIQRKLQEKGVDSETVSIALEDADDLRAALAYARKRGFGAYRRGEADEKRITKELSSMARQGFSLDLCRRVVALDREEAEETMGGGGF
jgi:regulatory protein